jgi:hypothetical protein
MRDRDTGSQRMDAAQQNAPGNISSRMNAADIFNDSLSHHMNMVAT